MILNWSYVYLEMTLNFYFINNNVQELLWEGSAVCTIKFNSLRSTDPSILYGNHCSGEISHRNENWQNPLKCTLNVVCSFLLLVWELNSFLSSDLVHLLIDWILSNSFRIFEINLLFIASGDSKKNSFFHSYESSK